MNNTKPHRGNIVFTVTLLFLVVFFNACKQEEKSIANEKILEKAAAIHKGIITLDSHIDINVYNFTDSINYTQELNTQVNIPNLKKGDLDVPWFIAYTEQDSLTSNGYSNALKNAMNKFEAIHKLTKTIAPEEIMLATTSEDVRRINASGKKVAMIGIENGYPIGNNIKRVKEFFDLGGRYMSLSHNGHNQLCDSHTGEEEGVWMHNGLSDLGKRVIHEMNKLGMMIDISHASKESSRQMFELSKAPIIASHSSARALCNHSRNLDDEQLDWIKHSGGVVQVVAYRSYLNTKKYNARIKKLTEIRDELIDSLGIKLYSNKEYMALSSEQQLSYIDTIKKVQSIYDEKKITMKNSIPPDVNVSDFIDHIDYIVKRIGLDHVGISSDFDGGGGIQGWEDASETMNITIELVKRGYTENQIDQLWSSNLLRVLDEVGQVAKEIRTRL